MTSILDYLEHWATVQPGKRVHSFLGRDGRERESCTYLSLHERSRRLAEYLSLQSRLRRGERVLLVYPSGLEIIAAFFACARIGVIPVPAPVPTSMGFEASVAKLAFIAADCEPKAILTIRAVCRRVADARGGADREARALSSLAWIATDEVTGHPSSEFRNDPDPILMLQYTSGSTSDPKAVIVSHENVVHNALNTIDHVPTGVSWLPHHHDMGFLGYSVFPVVTGGTAHSLSPADFLARPLLWLETMSRARATYASSPNFGFEYCLREDKVPSEHLDKLDLSSLRVLMTASEPVRVDTYVRFLERFARCGLQPRAHVSAYGLAENTLAVTNYGRRTLAVDRRLLQRGVVSMERARPVNGNQLHLLSCGKPLDGIGVRIVHPDSRVALGEQRVGEIWVSGKSVGKGYWNRPGLTRQIFDNTVANDRSDRNRYLRTGDLGFIHEEELFVCGRIKDIIIIRGLNYHPHDIEAIVEQASQAIRPGGVAAFDVAAEEGGLIVMAEVRSVGIAPEPAVISRAIRRRYHIEPGIIVFVPPRTIARTTSGKIARSLTRARWRNGELPVLATHVAAGERAQADCVARLRERLEDMVDIHDLADREECTLAEIGIDSLNAVVLLADLKSLLEQVGAGELARELDGRLLQRLTIVELFSLLDRCENAPGEPAASVRDILARIREEQDTYQRDCMRDDAGLAPMGHLRTHVGAEPLTGVLLTGATGFFGPFLLRSLLRKTPYTYYVLTRASGPAHALDRVRAALRRAGIWTPALDDELDKRVHVVCGDLAQPDLGMNSEDRTLLTSRAQAVCHNAAMVNYVLNYDALKPHNVDGTRELLRLCFTGTPKEFHLISSTFIFGWSVKDILWETDDNADMANLDFGYAQSKWVAEQLALAAERQGLKVRIYRPSLISASADAIGSRDDIAIRLLAFMINQGLAVNARNQISFLPADITADNIAAIFGQREISARTLHVTVDRSYNMMDITRLITDAYGYHFSYHEIPRFISEMNRLCTPSDPLYPLLDFFNFSYPKISAMQHKRYDNSRYREARRQTGIHRDDPSLQETLSCMIAYMIREGLIPSAGAELRRGRRGRSAPPFPTEVGQVRLRPP